MNGLKFLAIALVTIILASAFAGVVDAGVEHPNVEPKEEANDPVVENRGSVAQHSESLGDTEHRTVRDARERGFKRERPFEERQRLEHESPWRDGEDAHGEMFGELGHPYTHAFEGERYIDEPYLNPEFETDRLSRNGVSRCEFTPAPTPKIDWARYEAHDPIAIDGNDDFAAQASSEGWAGDGTEGNPYIIENYDINASTAHGIHIENTDVYFIIRNCVIHHGKSNSKYGIYFYTVTNGKINNVTSYNNYYGIYMNSSSYNTVSDCDAYNNSDSGIKLSHSSYNTISNCNFYNHTTYDYGFYMIYSTNNTISNCGIYNNDYGVYLTHSSYNNIKNCDIHDNLNRGIQLDYSSNNEISDCDVSNNHWGITLKASQNNTISNCNIHDYHEYGINLDYPFHEDVLSSNNRIINCTVSGNDIGICLGRSSNNIVTDCNVSNNYENAILVYYSSNNKITNCTARHDPYKVAVNLISSNNNTILHCIVYNAKYGFFLRNSVNNTLSNCVVYDTTYGFYLESFSNNTTVTDCTVYNNSHAFYLKSSSNAEIHYCDIHGNTHYGVYTLNLEDVYQVNATYCWWGSGSGPYHAITNSDAAGDKVSDNVLYDPWLTAPVGGIANQVPTISITSPSSDSTVSGTITISGTASDPDGTVQSVEVSIDDNTFATNKLTVSGTTFWSASWDTTQYPDSSHTVYVRAYDGTDYSIVKSVTVTVNQTYVNQAPSVTISSPNDDETVSGTVTVSGSASDPDGGVSIVQIRIDSGSWITAAGTTSWSYSWDTTKVSDGSHTISVRSFDSTDYSTIDSVNVNVKNAEEAKPSEIPWLYIILLVIILIVVVAAAGIGIKRKRKKVASPQLPS